MLFILLIFTGILLGFWSYGILYTLRSSNLIIDDETDITDASFDVPSYNLNATFDVPRSNCYDIAIRCPDNNEDCNCIGKCGIGFTETHVLLNSNTVFNNQLLEPGKYCLPVKTVQCDKRLGHLLYTNGTFLCQCKYPDILGGPFCNERRNCFRGFLRSKKSQKLIDIYNVDPEDEYFCSCDIYDENGNELINLPGDPLECHKDPCKMWLRSHESNVGFDSETGNCECGEFTKTRVTNMFIDNPKSPCSSCYIREVPDLDLTVMPFRCASKNGNLEYASPCRDFELIAECERVPVNIKFNDFMTFQEITIKKDTYEKGLYLP